MKNKKQIVFIHGGMTFKDKKNYINYLKTRPISIEKKIKWSDDYLDKKLGRDFDIIRLTMPLKDNAKYEEWKIHFERHFSLFRKDITLIGISLGGIFLAKYLSENKFPKRILATHLICPPFDNTIEAEDLVGGFKLKPDMSLFEKNSKNTNLFFSRNDDIVPVTHAEKYKNKLANSNLYIFENKNGHFKISEFPEIIKLIKSVAL